MEKVSYLEKINAESEYWGSLLEETLKYGIHHSIDLRKAQKIPIEELNVYGDPETLNILWGKERDFIISEAAEVKGKVLDLGCGTGWLTLELARNDMDVIGLDISKKCIKIAKKYLKNVKDVRGRARYRVTDLNNIKLKEKSFDVITAWGCLHHVQNIDHLIDEIFNALKPGGKFLVYDHVGENKIIKLIRKTIRSFMLNRKNFDESPFEGVTRHRFVNLIKNRFKIIITKNSLVFIINAIRLFRLHNLPTYLKLPIIKILKLFDDISCKLKILEGEYYLIYAKKNII